MSEVIEVFSDNIVFSVAVEIIGFTRGSPPVLDLRASNRALKTNSSLMLSHQTLRWAFKWGLQSGGNSSLGSEMGGCAVDDAEIVAGEDEEISPLSCLLLCNSRRLVSQAEWPHSSP